MFNAKSESDNVVVYRFASFELDERGTSLLRAGEVMALPPQARAVLACLVRCRPRTVSFDELRKIGWGDVVVADGSVRAAIHQIRLALSDTRERSRFVETVRHRGYRFVAQVEEGAACRQETAAFGPERQPPTPPVLVGRDTALVELVDALDQAHGRGRTCVVIGPPGVGKSRLARALIPLAEARGFGILEAVGAPEASGFAFDPWRRLLSARICTADAALLLRCRAIAPTVLDAFGDGPNMSWSPHDFEEAPAQRRQAFFEELANLWLELAKLQPLLLLVEDVHWADEASLAFFRYFTSVVAGAPLLVLVTCRQVAARENRSLARALDACKRLPDSCCIELTNLTVAATQALLGALRAPMEPDLITQVHALTGGNPLFALEVAKLVGGSDAPDALRLLREPNVDLQSVIRRRLDSMLERSRCTLMQASVVGYDFTVAELAAVSKQTPKGALASIDGCLEYSMLVQHAHDCFSFSHPVVRDVAYEALTLSERGELHHSLAAWLEQRGDDSGHSGLVKLAHHAYLGASAGDPERAIDYTRRCAEQAVRSTAWASAVTYYDRALQCVDLTHQPSPLTRIELGIGRAKAERAMGVAHATVNEDLLALAERAWARGSLELHARALLAYTGHGETAYSPTRFQGTYDRAEVALLERALSAGAQLRVESRVLLLCSLAVALAYSAERAQRERACDTAIHLARGADQPWLLARALLARIYCCAAPDNRPQRLSACDELVELAQRYGLQEQEIEARMTRAVCLLEAADMAAATDDEQRAISLAYETTSSRLRVRVERLALLRAAMSGDLGETERLARRCIDANPDDLIARALFVVRVSGLGLLRTGHGESAIGAVEAMVAAYPDALGVRCLLAATYAAFAHRDAAREQFDRVAVDNFARLPESINWLCEMGYLADAAVRLDDAARAKQVYDRLLPYADLFMFYLGEAMPAGPVAHWLGELATTRRDPTAAAHWLERARQLCHRMEAPLFLQYNAHAEARRLRLCDDESKEPRVQMLLAGITRFSHQSGALWLSTFARDFERDWPRSMAHRAWPPASRVARAAAKSRSG